MSVKFRLLAFVLLGALSALWLARGTAAQAPSNILYGLTINNQLVTFNSLTPGSISSTRALTGLAAGEMLLGIDFRPATGQLYALSSNNRLYTINVLTGAVTAIGNAPISPVLNSNVVGFDFNPVPDRIRVVTDAKQNLRVHPDTGAVAVIDTTVAFAAEDANANANPALVGAAYTNSIAGATSTTNYALDANLDVLVRQGSIGGTPDSPNGGKLFTVGALGVNIDTDTGFDIAAPGDVAYVSATMPNTTTTGLYSLNLNTGAMTLVGAIGGGQLIRGLAVATNFIPPNPSAPLAVVNAASFASGMVAPGSVSAAFGTFQTTDGQGQAGSTQPLPTSLNGVTVTVNGTAAGLFFVSNGQINFSVPANVADGLATVVVTSVNGTRTGTINIVRAAPGIFTALGNGTGAAAALVTNDGVNFQSTVNADGSARVLEAGTVARPNYLILFTTGIRRTPAANPNDANGVAESVTVTLQGIPAQVPFAGAHPSFDALDQINVVIPPQLAGAGEVAVQVIANGQASNTAIVRIGGTAPRVDALPVAFGQTVAGALTETDQVLRGSNGSSYFFDAYSFTARAGTGLAVDLRAQLFDALVMLYKRNTDGTLTLLAADDQLGGLGNGQVENENALLLTYLSETADYVVFVTSSNADPNAVGGYQLRLVANALQPLSYGATVNGAIAATDLQTSAGDYLDVYWFAGNAGDAAQIRMSAATFDPVLILAKNNGELVAANDNGGGGTDALIRQTLGETGVYVVIGTPFAPFIRGNYTLSLARGAAALAENETPLAGRALRMAPRGRAWFADLAARVIVPQGE